MTTPASTLLPPPGPALTLHMAAAKLRAAAEAAAARQAEDGRTDADWARDLDNALGGPIGVFCGLLTPELALDLCDWLDATATQAVRHAGTGGTEQAVTGGFPAIAAQRILGEAS
jgi:hypothetical protein